MAKPTGKAPTRKVPAAKAVADTVVAPRAAAPKAVVKAAEPRTTAKKPAAARAAAAIPGATILKVPQRAGARAASTLPYRERLLDYLVKGGAVAEIGVWKGDFAATLIEKLQPRALHLIDPWLFQPQYPGRMYGGLTARNQAAMDRLHKSVVARFANRPEVLIHRETSVEAMHKLPDASLDVVFVDGDHSFEVVLQDFVLAHRKVRPGGYICGDDWGWKDEQGRTSVRDAVLAYLQMQPVDFIHIRNGQVLIRRP